MTTNQSNPFTAFLGGEQESHQRNNDVDTKVNTGQEPSPAQLKVYLDTCARKKVQPLDITTLTKRTISAEIEKVIALPFPASDAQMEKVQELLTQLTNGGVKINFSAEKIAGLTGGKDGTASQMIEFLLQQMTKHNVVGPIREAQADQLVGWFLCPDIPFEEYGVYVSVKVARPDVSESAWEKKLCNAVEFKEQLMAKLDSEQASKLIEQNRNKFAEWKRTRITQNQMKFIQTLEQRLASLYVPSESTLALDEDGNVVQLESKAKKTYNPVAHQPLTIMQLAQLSFDEAKLYIEQCQNALADRNTSSLSNSTDQDELNQKHSTYESTRSTGMITKSPLEARIKEFSVINDFLYAMDSILGYESTHMHEELSEVVLDNSGNGAKYARKLSKLMLESLEFDTSKTLDRSIGRLYILADESVILTDLVEQTVADISRTSVV